MRSSLQVPYWLLAACACIAVLAIAAVPRARAVYSSPVTVVNTPLPSQELSASPAQIVETGCLNTGPGQLSQPCFALASSGYSSGTFTVPAGQAFVVTSVEIRPVNPGAGTINISMAQSSCNCLRENWLVPNTGTTVLQFPSGIVVTSGSTLSFSNNSNSPGLVSVVYRGYLEPGS